MNDQIKITGLQGVGKLEHLYQQYLAANTTASEETLTESSKTS